MKKLWADRAWDDYLYWQMQDKKTLKRINELLTLPTAKAGGFLLQPLLHWPIPFGTATSYTVSTS